MDTKQPCRAHTNIRINNSTCGHSTSSSSAAGFWFFLRLVFHFFMARAHHTCEEERNRSKVEESSLFVGLLLLEQMRKSSALQISWSKRSKPAAKTTWPSPAFKRSRFFFLTLSCCSFCFRLLLVAAVRALWEAQLYFSFLLAAFLAACEHASHSSWALF